MDDRPVALFQIRDSTGLFGGFADKVKGKIK